MRKYLSSTSSFLLSSDNDCSSPSYTGCHFDDNNPLTSSLSTSTSFASCSFRGLVSNTHGGAIYISSTSIKLTVDKCSFIDCTAKNGCGGAIYAYPAKEVTSKETLFIRCNIAASGDQYDGGGGIFMTSVGDVSFPSSQFLECSIPYCGGGVALWSCNSNSGNERTFEDCRFVFCRGNRNGGAFLAWRNTFYMTISNTLFSFCSNKLGGAFELSYSSWSTSFIAFCIFHKNTGTYGNSIYSEYLQANPFIHSFLTSSETEQIYMNPPVSETPHSTESTRYPNWLPLTTLNEDF